MESPAVEQAKVHMEHDSDGYGPEELQEGTAGERQEHPAEEPLEDPEGEHTLWFNRLPLFL